MGVATAGRPPWPGGRSSGQGWPDTGEARATRALERLVDEGAPVDRTHLADSTVPLVELAAAA